MKPSKHPVTRTVTIFMFMQFAIFTIALIAFNVAGAHVNTSESLPLGLYWTVNKLPEKGDLVTFSPPESQIFEEAVKRGYIDKFHRIMIKRIVATTGDRISITHQGITINGTLLNNATLHNHDGEGRLLQPCLMENYELAADEVFLYSDHNPNSFDGRYFGVQNKKHIKNVVRPVLLYVPSL